MSVGEDGDRRGKAVGTERRCRKVREKSSKESL